MPTPGASANRDLARAAAHPRGDGADKWPVRRARRAARREIVAGRDLVADAAALARHGMALVAGGGAGATRGALPPRTVTLYRPRPGEPPVEELARALLSAGHRVLVPITLPDLDLDWADLTPGRIGTDAPDGPALGTSVLASVDLALVPGLSADRTGTRLGQGGGCYDRTLPRLAAGCRTVVVLHPGEIVDDPLPAQAHDHPVDAALTAEGLTPLR